LMYTQHDVKENTMMLRIKYEAYLNLKIIAKIGKLKTLIVFPT